jgi:hypothetical protein
MGPLICGFKAKKKVAAVKFLMSHGKAMGTRLLAVGVTQKPPPEAEKARLGRPYDAVCSRA